MLKYTLLSKILLDNTGYLGYSPLLLDERRWVSLPKFGTFAAIGECMY